MRIFIIGVTGRVGSRIAAEALARGHAVGGLARNAGPGQVPDGVVLAQGDARIYDRLPDLVRGHDAVVVAAFLRDLFAEFLVGAVRRGGVNRLFIVGGAASLEFAPGRLLLDLPDFPEPYRPEAEGAKRFLDELRAIDNLDWSYLSPAAEFEPGERTGRFRLGADALLTDAEGRSRISMEDYAIAALDELEAPSHLRQRYSIAY